MVIERTLCFVKSESVKAGHYFEIIHMIGNAGFKIVAAKMAWPSKQVWERFYAVHSSRPFFESFVASALAGPVFLMVLEGDYAVKRFRELMGATTPERAAEGTIRRKFGTSIEKNAVHGSDAPETAAFEISIFFSGSEIF